MIVCAPKKTETEIVIVNTVDEARTAFKDDLGDKIIVVVMSHRPNGTNVICRHALADKLHNYFGWGKVMSFHGRARLYIPKPKPSVLDKLIDYLA